MKFSLFINRKRKIRFNVNIMVRLISFFYAILTERLSTLTAFTVLRVANDTSHYIADLHRLDKRKKQYLVNDHYIF